MYDLIEQLQFRIRFDLDNSVIDPLLEDAKYFQQDEIATVKGQIIKLLERLFQLEKLHKDYLN